MGRPATPDDIDLVRTLAESGWTDAAMGARLGRSRDSVQWIRRKNNIRSSANRRFCDIELVRTLAEAGWTDVEIGVRIGRSKNVVGDIRRKNEIQPAMNRRFLDDEITKIQTMVSQGKSSQEIAKSLGRTKSSITEKRCKEGILAPDIGPNSLKAQARRDAHTAVLQERRAQRRAARSEI